MVYLFSEMDGHRSNIMLKNFAFIAVAVVATLYAVDACNSGICGPTVSKCMLINCCNCDMSDKANCSCCVDCAICLTKLYTECCSCVGLCPVPDPNHSHTKTSTIEDLPDPIDGLFNALTEVEDVQQRWTTFTYAVDLDKLVFKDGGQSKSKAGDNMDIKIIRADHAYKSTVTPPPTETKEPVLGIRNCTVAFFSDCLSMSKCKDSCTSMGASKYRWFHQHGCCQCVGSSCYDYGLSQPHCLQCPEQTDLRYEEENLYADSDWRQGAAHKHHNSHKVDPAMDSF